jgi:GH25 family lysozyme M1 (1,4-beta-N-acetylmuramidase)
MVKGVQRMCGTYMMFNSLTGVFEKTVNQKRVIDISVHNGNVNWDKVKESGLVDGVILRSSFGVGYTDGKFERNVKELNRLGIPYSVYHFSYAENKAEAKREADYLISVLNKYPVKISSNLFSIYYDLEDWEISSTGENSYGISKNTYADMITTFANTVQKATGIKVRVYASKNYIETRFPASVQGYATWVAQWSHHINYKGAYEGWQYTSKGRVPGIDGNVDMSIFYY